MKIKVVTTVSTLNNEGLSKLEASLKMFDWDYKIIQDSAICWNNWGGWDWVVNWCKSDEAKDYTHIIYTDGFDTLALTGQEEVKQKLTKLLEPNPEALIYSVEKHWFPHEIPGWESYLQKFNEQLNLPESNRWRYVNGGQYAGTKEAIINWYTQAPKDRNNQAWGNYYYGHLNQNKGLILDFDCELFQTISHSGKHHGAADEFDTGYTLYGKNRVFNNYTKKLPCFVHANGIKNPEESRWMYQMLNL